MGTPTLKVKRGEVMKSYAAAIDAMYESREKFVPFVPNAGASSAQAEPKNCWIRRTSSLWWGGKIRLVLACNIQYRCYVLLVVVLLYNKYYCCDVNNDSYL